MATFRETPYAAFNYLVELEPGQGTEVQAGFSEVSGLNTEVTVAEYRAGNSVVNHVRKVPGIHKSGDVTLKRGVIGANNIYEWIEKCRDGKLSEAKRTITIKLLNAKFVQIGHVISVRITSVFNVNRLLGFICTKRIQILAFIAS